MPRPPPGPQAKAVAAPRAIAPINPTTTIVFLIVILLPAVAGVRFAFGDREEQGTCQGWLSMAAFPATAEK
jgi:hypothetical protein